MKKIIAIAALAILVSSCGNKMTLMKRHYTKGFYMHHTGQVTQPVAHASAASKVSEMEPVRVNYVSGEAKNPVLIAESRSSVVTHETSRSFQSQVVKHESNHKLFGQKKIVVSLKKHFFTFSEVKKQQRAGNSGNLIVEVILALFPVLCLIAVYLHDGGITTNFWITLVLHLTIYLECIFALLVVLGALNFA